MKLIIQTDDIQLEIPLTNYRNDVKHVDNFGNDWEWLETDLGASSGPFTGQHGLLIEPTERTPQGFFNLFFDDSMWKLISQETNIYARQCIQSLWGIYHANIMFIHIIIALPLFFVLIECLSVV